MTRLSTTLGIALIPCRPVHVLARGALPRTWWWLAASPLSCRLIRCSVRCSIRCRRITSVAALLIGTIATPLLLLLRHGLATRPGVTCGSAGIVQVSTRTCPSTRLVCPRIALRSHGEVAFSTTAFTSSASASSCWGSLATQLLHLRHGGARPDHLTPLHVAKQPVGIVVVSAACARPILLVLGGPAAAHVANNPGAEVQVTTLSTGPLVCIVCAWALHCLGGRSVWSAIPFAKMRHAAGNEGKMLTTKLRTL